MTPNTRPLSAQELCVAVREAQPIDLARLDRVLHVDADRGLVEVQSGTSWKALASQLRPGDPVVAATRTLYRTVGESVAANAAGPDGRPTVNHVESLTLVTPDGQLRRIDRAGNPGLFSLVVGGQGLFGAVYSVTLRIASLERAVAEAQAPRALVGQLSPLARELALLVPPPRTDALIKLCRERCAEWRIGLESLRVRRTLADHETFLRLAAREHDELTLGLRAGASLGAEVRLAQLRGELIDLAIAHGGGFAIAYAPYATRAQTDACYPQLANFLAEQRRLDPRGRLGNAWLRRERRLLAQPACEVRWGR